MFLIHRLIQKETLIMPSVSHITMYTSNPCFSNSHLSFSLTMLWKQMWLLCFFRRIIVFMFPSLSMIHPINKTSLNSWIFFSQVTTVHQPLLSNLLEECLEDGLGGKDGPQPVITKHLAVNFIVVLV